MKRQILVIDDDITSLDIVSYVFENKGYHVERRGDGHAAIEFIRSETPDLVIVDLMMPNINGVETVREMRKLGYTNKPVIAFTAVDDVNLHNAAKEAGCDEVITKPCPVEKLVKIIEKFLPSK